MSDRDARFEASFMDDYFAEADDHIVTARRCLLALEATLGQPVAPAVLDELFRSCHSLKGISAMVELHEAEALAHHMESCLRAVREGSAELTPARFDALLGAAQTLEAVVAARRTGTELPAIDGPIATLQALAAQGTQAPAGGTAVSKREGEAVAGEARHWIVSFVPSADLTARGVKVDSVRARLLQAGSILRVAPRVLPGGGICFDFDVRTDREDALAALTSDGVSYALADAGVAPDDAHPPAAPAPLDLLAAGPANFVRVELGRLDDLMRLVGDLVVTRARLDDSLQRLEGQFPPQAFRTVQEHDALLERQLRDLREAIMRVRLVPVGEVFRRMPFVVRDLARDHAKRVRLDVTGQGTEIDKFLIERMMDPVLHLVRNAISHGIETPDERIAAGKPPEGVIQLRASAAGESVIIDIADDGRGIDVASVEDRARAQGLLPRSGVFDNGALLDILCTSGFSTREEADRASGRGVGMAVVRSAVHELGGTLAVETAAGRGTTFTIALPLTLAITDALVAHVGGQTFAVPQAAVREVLEVGKGDLRAIENNELITHRSRALPVVRLSRLFRLESAERPRYHVIVAGTGPSALGILVDRILGQREIVVKTITDPLIRVDGVSGATELGDGRLVLILDVPALTGRVRERARASERISA